MTDNVYRLNSKYFKFKISNPSVEETLDVKLGGNSGFIDAMKTQDYVDFSSESEGTLEQFTSKGLGYIRWLSLCTALSNFGIFFLEVDSLEGATHIDTPTSIEFTIGYEQPDAMYIKATDGTEYKGIDALKYLVACVMCNNYKSFVQIFDPTKRTYGERPSNLPYGINDKLLTANKICDSIEDAYSYITITQVDGPDGNETIDM